MKRLVLIALTLAYLFPATAYANSVTDQKTAIHKMEEKTLARLYKEKPYTQRLIRGAVGYAGFSSGELALLWISGGYGHGIAHDNQTGKDIYMETAKAGLGLGLGTAGSYSYAPGFDARVRQSLLFFKGDKKDINQAISGRVPIWTVSLKMFAAHPLAGVGACGYRYAYPKYAAPGDPFYKQKTGPSHPHQILLEMASETGAVGLAGLLVFFALLIGSWRRAGREDRRLMLPYGLALWGALFPINTGFALYSAIWGQVIFWLASLYVASGRDGPARIETGTEG